MEKKYLQPVMDNMFFVKSTETQLFEKESPFPSIKNAVSTGNQSPTATAEIKRE